MVGFIVAKNNDTLENDSNHIVAHHQVKLLLLLAPSGALIAIPTYY